MSRRRSSNSIRPATSCRRGAGRARATSGRRRCMALRSTAKTTSGSRQTPGHHMLKFTRQGKFLLQIGKNGQSKGNTDTANLNRAAEAEVDLAANEVYVADGYGNRRVIVFDADTGAYKRHWGAYGKKPDDTDPGPYDPAAPITAGIPHRALRADRQRRPGVRLRPRERPHSGVQKGRHIRQGSADREEHARRRRDLRHRVLTRYPAAPRVHRRRREPSRVDAFCATRCRWSAISATADGIPASSTPCTTCRSIRRATSTRSRRTKESGCRSSTTRASARLQRRRTDTAVKGDRKRKNEQ